MPGKMLLIETGFSRLCSGLVAEELALQRRDLIKAGLGLGTLVATGPAREGYAQSGTKRIGLLIARPETDAEGKKQEAAFERGLAELGWTPNRNIEIHTRWETPDTDRRLNFVRELLAVKPDVLVINSTAYLRIAKPEVGNIPVVFIAITDPVAQGFVQSLAHPGGTSTGFGAEEPSLGSKWMELLKEIAPSVSNVSVVYNPDTAPMAPLFVPPIEAVRSGVPFAVRRAPVRNDAELDAAIADAGQSPSSGLIFLPDSFLASRSNGVVAAVAKRRIPAVYSIAAFARNGGLVSLGVERADQFYRASRYVDRILEGENPADLPVQIPDKFEIVINLKTAKSLGLAIPPALLARADEVIE
jgi:putative ABC transport system substrate-binding protein